MMTELQELIKQKEKINSMIEVRIMREQLIPIATRTIKVVAKHFWLENDVVSIVSTNRVQELQTTRKLAVKILKDKYHYTYIRLGLLFGWKRHAAMIYCYKEADKLIKKDPDIQKVYSKIIQELQELW